MANDYLSKLEHDGFEIASNQKRGLAFFIDELLISALVIILFWDTIVNTTDINEVINTINSALFEVMFIKFAYHTFFYYQYGATIGKIILKIKVIELNGFVSPTFLTAMNRSGIRLVSEFFFYFGFIFAFFDEIHQALHDKLARTVVVDA